VYICLIRVIRVLYKLNRIVVIPIFIGMLQIMPKIINAAQVSDTRDDDKNYRSRQPKI
jgi:hypothetical protein